jgi:hypothetical protein
MNKRKDMVENIVKERKAWRDKLREISCKIEKCKEIELLRSEISELKVRINPYGMYDKEKFHDSYIWDQIEKVEENNNGVSENFEINKKIFVELISCVLKYDWERTKDEVKGNFQIQLIGIELIISFIIYSVLWVYNCKSFTNEIVNNFIISCYVFIIYIVLSVSFVYQVDKIKNKKEFKFYIFLLAIVFIPFVIYVYILWRYLPFNSLCNFFTLLPSFLAVFLGGIKKMFIIKKNIDLFIETNKKIINKKEKPIMIGDKKVIDKKIIIKEYDGLRNAITQKIQLHNSLTTFMITSVIAILAFALKSNNILLYLLPFGIVIPISMRIAYYRSGVGKLSAYIITYIEKNIEGLNWETRNYNLIKENKNNFLWNITSAHYYEGLIISIICYLLYSIDYIKNKGMKDVWGIVIPFTLVIWEILITKKIASIHDEKEKWIKKWENIQKKDEES